MDAPADLIITVSDIRQAGFCARGIRKWFETQGLDFKRLLAEGYPATELLATGDAQAAQVVASAVRRRNG